MGKKKKSDSNTHKPTSGSKELKQELKAGVSWTPQIGHEYSLNKVYSSALRAGKPLVQHKAREIVTIW